MLGNTAQGVFHFADIAHGVNMDSVDLRLSLTPLQELDSVPKGVTELEPIASRDWNAFDNLDPQGR